jgi:hypothetical protein
MRLHRPENAPAFAALFVSIPGTRVFLHKREIVKNRPRSLAPESGSFLAMTHDLIGAGYVRQCRESAPNVNQS